MVLNEKVKLGGKEFLPTKVVVESVAAPSPIDETSSLDQRLNYRWLDLRSDKNLLLMQVKSCFTNSFREFLDNNNLEIPGEVDYSHYATNRSQNALYHFIGVKFSVLY